MRAASHICPVTLTPHRRLRNAFTCHQPINCGPFVLLGQHQLDFSWPLCAALSGPRLPASDPRELLRKDPLPSFFSGIRRCLRAPGLPLSDRNQDSPLTQSLKKVESGALGNSASEGYFHHHPLAGCRLMEASQSFLCAEKHQQQEIIHAWRSISVKIFPPITVLLHFGSVPGGPRSPARLSKGPPDVLPAPLSAHLLLSLPLYSHQAVV